MKTNVLKNFFKQTNLWAGIVPIQLIGIYALYSIVVGNAPSWWWIASIIGYVCLVMIGVSAGYHRLICHKGYQVHPLVRKIILYFGALAGQESPIFWATVHRGYHHLHADRAKDPHSPRHGFFHSYIGWMFTLEDNLSPRYTIDLLRDSYCAFIHRHYHKILWITYGIVALINLDLCLYLLIFPAFIGLHTFGINTSLNHYRQIGYRNYDTKDDSVNSPWLFFLILGEAWHNNHHGRPGEPNYGRRWWELDPTYYFIKLVSIK